MRSMLILVAGLLAFGCDEAPDLSGAANDLGGGSLLQHMAEGEGAGPNLAIEGLEADEGEGAERLDSQSLASVVGQNRPNLRRCYQLATRGQSQTSAVRMDVDVTVGANGDVSNVSVRGGDGRLSTCVRREVRGWQFPAQQAEASTSFPVVFQPGG